VLDNPTLTNEKLSDRLPNRTAAAVSYCRIGIGRFFTGKPINGYLPRAFVRRLEELNPGMTGQV
jgi:hypothetical protein